MMISATAPMFTTIYARIFLKEAIAVADILNLVLVFVGIVFIVKPPFLFGHSQIYQEDPEALQVFFKENLKFPDGFLINLFKIGYFVTSFWGHFLTSHSLCHT